MASPFAVVCRSFDRSLPRCRLFSQAVAWSDQSLKGVIWQLLSTPKTTLRLEVNYLMLNLDVEEVEWQNFTLRSIPRLLVTEVYSFHME